MIMDKKKKPPQRQLTREEKRKLVIDRIKGFPELGDRVISRQLGVSHTFVGDVRREIGLKLQLDTSKNEYLSHPYIVANPQILDGLSERGLRAIRSKDVVEIMAEKSLKSPVHAQRLLYKSKIAESENAFVELAEADIMLFCDDLRTGLTEKIADNSVDLILCDPPYGARYIELYSHIGRLARMLRPGASLVVMTGQSHLNRVMRLLDEHLAYNWCISYLTSNGGGSTLIHQRKAMASWKPVLHYCKGKYEGRMIYDVVIAAPPDDTHRTLHHWQQDLHGFEVLVQRFSNKGDTVLDCCMGSGTTGVAAVRLGRKFIGCDIDPQSVETAKRRIAEALQERVQGE